MSALEDKTAEILDKSQAALGAFADKLVELTKQYGPDVADAALTMARIDAMDHLITPIIWLVIWVTAAILLKKYGWPFAVKHAEKSDGVSYIVPFLGGAITGLIAIFDIFALANLWAWVGIFEPKLWLAKRILGL